ASNTLMHKDQGSQHRYYPFQADDITVKDCPIRFFDPQREVNDSVVVNLTISNELYRLVVGKTFKAIGSDQPAPVGYSENHNSGETVTFQFRAEGKVQINNAKHSTVNGQTHDYGVSGGHLGYAPVFNCDADGTNTMKRIIGIIPSIP